MAWWSGCLARVIAVSAPTRVVPRHPTKETGVPSSRFKTREEYEAWKRGERPTPAASSSPSPSARKPVLLRPVHPDIARFLGLLLVALTGLPLLFAAPILAALLTVLGVIVGAIAQAYGRSFVDWFSYGFLVFPVALIHVLIAGRSTAMLTKCPHCAELVKSEAKVCRYCHRELG